MKQDILTTAHRLSRRVAPLLGPFRAVARHAFRFALKKRYSQGELMRARQNGRTWWLDPDVALRGEHQEFDTTLWLRKVLEPGMVAIDVGANVGQMTLEAASLVGSAGRVIAIEPGTGNVQVLRRHLTANGLDAITEVIEAACSDRVGTVNFFIVGDSADVVGSGHSLLEAAVAKDKARFTTTEVVVPACTIDDLCASRGLKPDAIKVDVEGGELAVLRGMARTLRTARPSLRLGFHPFAFEDPLAASDEIRLLLERANYSLEAPERGVLDLAEYDAYPR